MNPIPVHNPRPILVTASTSPIKTTAVRNVFGRYRVNLFNIHANSGVNAQPVNGETYTGALNRIRDARSKLNGPIRDTSWVIAIENGIFSERINDRSVWSDRAVIIVQSPSGKQYRADSAPVIFPDYCVETAKAKGFHQTTVGQVMAETGVVASGDDPHVSLPPFHPRQEHLEKSLNMIAAVMEHAHVITPETPQPANALKA